jgi:hypothetical protein
MLSKTRSMPTYDFVVEKPMTLLLLMFIPNWLAT